MHSQNIWIGYVVESAYAGGDGGSAYAQTKCTNSNLQSFELIEGGWVAPYVTYERNALQLTNQTINKRYLETLAKVEKVGSMSCFLQNSSLLELAIGCSAGSLPTSRVMHWETADQKFESYGCYLTSYRLGVEPGAMPRQQLEWSAYSTKLGSDVDALTQKAWLSTTPVQAGAISVTLNSTDYKFTKIDFAVRNTHLRGRVTNDVHNRFPYLIEREITLSLGFYDAANTILDDLFSTTATDHDIVITITGLGALTLENLVLQEENQAENELGWKTYEISLGQGPNTTISWS